MAVSRVSKVILSTMAAASAGRPTNEEWKKGQQADKDAAGAVAAKDAKMAAVNKVTQMLEDLQAQVLAEGEAEAATYNKFACFCKTTQKDKSKSIATGKTDKDSLSADIKKYSKQRDALDKKIADHEDNIQKAEKKMKQANEKRAATLKVYQTNEADLSAAIAGVTEATKVLKASKQPSLLQLQGVAATVKQAALMADALGLGGEEVQSAAAFLQTEQPAVEMEDYKFHSSGIIKTLEKLTNDFRKQKDAIDADEVQSVQEHTMFIQDRTDFVKAQTHALEQAKADREQKIEDIGTASEELTAVSSQLLDDQQYLDELNTLCSDKAKTWDQRTRLRADELTAITQATGIVKSTVAEKTLSSTIRFAQTGATLHLASAVTASSSAMEAIEAEAEQEEASEAVGFLQKKSIKQHEPDEGKQMVISMLKGKGQQLKSTLLVSLASKLANDPLAQKRKYSSEKTASLNAKMAKQEALIAKLTDEIGTLTDEIAELEKNQATAEKERKDESTENANTVVEAKAGLAAVNMAIDILDKFYKTSAKAKVDLSLAQKGPLDDAPDAGFDNGEAYQGAGAESGGIIGMMEVIQSDFQRTIDETQSNEKKAKQDHLKFMTETSMSLAEKNMAKKEKTKIKDETESNFESASDSLDDQTAILVTSIKELIELKAVCVDTGMSYAERVARREDEIASLKKALCIFGAYSEYGPDGLADRC